ncbi:MAG TPA: hypothetical protein VLB44_16370 [Kofleriaceae bacterium]|nr:hypothetical protein [Kofleriaceae bacterium]
MENRYGVSPMMMLQLLEPMIFIVPILLWLLVIGPMFIYPLARWKAHREPHQDTQLGLKVALHYFRMVAFQLLLLGALILLWTIIRQSADDKGDFYRAGIALVLPAGLVFGVHTVLLDRTNDKGMVNVRRLFFGYNLLITGLIGFTALMMASQALFAKGSSGDPGRLFFAALLVYVTAWIACGVRFASLVGTDFSASAGPPQNVVPPSAPASMSSQGGGASLPSLGGGSFPPIDQK